MPEAEKQSGDRWRIANDTKLQATLIVEITKREDKIKRESRLGDAGDYSDTFFAGYHSSLGTFRNSGSELDK